MVEMESVVKGFFGSLLSRDSGTWDEGIISGMAIDGFPQT